MIDPVEERRPPLSPQLALRVAMLGGVAFVLFAIIFFRLWFLQVLSGDQYLTQARDNRVRSVRIVAPRGNIVDRSGRTLVENRVATVVMLDPEALPASERLAAATWFDATKKRLARRKALRGPPVPIPPIATPALRQRVRALARIIGTTPRTIQDRVIRSLGLVPYSAVTIKVDVPDAVRNVLLERADRFPGVDVEKRYLRRYPEHTLAAQLMGTIGEISPPELGLARFKGVKPGTIIGKEGLERAYDRYLRGVDGATRITVDALGRPKGEAVGRDPVPGRSLRTSLDLGLQDTGQKYLSQVIAQGPGSAGAFVALDPRNGQILAMGSDPSYDPSVLSRPVTNARYKQLFGEEAGSPRFNRAIGGSYPTGSTFKPITALAGLSTGLITPSDVINDTGCITIGADHEERCNAGRAPLGPVDLRSALSKSSDVYFYLLGSRLNGEPDQPLQRWARRLGLGHTTGIDVPGEFGGLVPDRAWRAEVNQREERWEKKTGRPCCLYSDKRPWTVGDEVGLAIGQGDLQATPLQMAVAYGAIANGGEVVRPHLGVAVEDANGRELQRIEPGAPRKIDFDPVALQAIRDGLHNATIDGTSADVFKGWNQNRYPVFGKTGTAQRNNRPGDQSWYVAFVPDAKRPIVVAVTVEDGGFGAEAAAPVARTILAKWYGQPTDFVTGSSRTY
jgi:penicillin-binding protein 2